MWKIAYRPGTSAHFFQQLDKISKLAIHYLALIVCGNWTPKGLQTDINGLLAMLGTPVSVILPLVVVPLVLVPVNLVAICIKFPWEINPFGKPSG